MALFEDIQAQIGLLKEFVGVVGGGRQPVFDKADPLILEVDAGKALLAAPFDDLAFP